MIERFFSLMPFPGSSPLPNVKISGSVTRKTNTLVCRYELCGPLVELVVPEAVAVPVRRDGLWREMCFELFFAGHGSKQYWEVNLSPAGHWNVYCFAAYRQEMRQEVAICGIPFEVRQQEDVLDLTLKIDLSGVVSPDVPLDIAVCVVVNAKSGNPTHWALSHPGPQPDFHDREGFVLNL